MSGGSSTALFHLGHVSVIGMGGLLGIAFGIARTTPSMVPYLPWVPNQYIATGSGMSDYVLGDDEPPASDGMMGSSSGSGSGSGSGGAASYGSSSGEQQEKRASPPGYTINDGARVTTGEEFASRAASTTADAGAGLWPVTLYFNGERDDGIEARVPETICPSDADARRGGVGTREGLELATWAAQFYGMECNPHADTFKHGGPPGTHPCRLYDRAATRIQTCQDFHALYKAQSGEAEGLELWMVPADKWFVYPPGELGRVVVIPPSRIDPPRGVEHPITVETISDSPRVYHLHNFLTVEETDALIAHALADTDAVTGLQRSTTGAEHQVSFNKVRTSDNAFDSVSPAARATKRRAIEVLGMGPYDEQVTDGLQVLRYNESKAYIAHLDYLDDNNSGHDYDSANDGSNRFATILFYLSDVEEGGETVFPKGVPIDDGVVDQLDGVHAREIIPHSEVLQEATDANATALFKKGSWEYEMVGQCRGRLAVRPKKAHAILFYSQNPDGSVDRMSKHGGCPVLGGTKWAANLWIWNRVRLGYPRAPRKAGAAKWDSSAGIGRDRMVKGGKKEQAVLDKTPQKPQPQQPQASFRNNGVLGNVELFYEETRWDDFSNGKVLNVNTFEGHVWNVRVNNKLAYTWVISAQPLMQNYELTPAMI